MKKLVMMMAVVALLVTGMMSVSAAEVDGEFVSNMDGETYLELRLAQIQEALDADKITPEEARELIEHVEQVAAEASYGNGPTFGIKGDGNATCILGDDSDTGIFRSESGGQRTGNGNGVGLKTMDGTGGGNSNASKGENRGSGRGRGNGNSL